MKFTELISIALPSRVATIWIVVLTLVFGAFVSPQALEASQAQPYGYAVRDVARESGCVIQREQYAGMDPSSGIVASWEEACPAGSVVETAPVRSAADASSIDGIFVPLTGNDELDAIALQEAKLSLVSDPEQSSPSTHVPCVDQGWSASMQFYASEPGVTVYATVYYWRDAFCSSGVSYTTIWLSHSAQQRFAKSLYYGSQTHHGCASMNTSGKSHWVGIDAPLGYLFTNETRSGTWVECETASSTSYTGSVYLYT